MRTSWSGDSSRLKRHLCITDKSIKVMHKLKYYRKHCRNLRILGESGKRTIHEYLGICISHEHHKIKRPIRFFLEWFTQYSLMQYVIFLWSNDFYHQSTFVTYYTSISYLHVFLLYSIALTWHNIFRNHRCDFVTGIRTQKQYADYYYILHLLA